MKNKWRKVKYIPHEERVRINRENARQSHARKVELIDLLESMKNEQIQI